MNIVSFDVIGIQSYVFASNVLRDNVGASMLVRRALDAWLVEEGSAVFGEGWHRPTSRIHDGAEAELVVAAGGNAQVLTRDAAKARDLVRRLTWRLRHEAPGLRMVVDIVEWDGAQWGGARGGSLLAQRSLARRKLAGIGQDRPDLPAVIERCQITGEPASHRRRLGDDEPKAVSEDIARRRQAVTGLVPFLRQRPLLAEALDGMRQAGFHLGNDLDKLGRRTNEQSYIGVVHIDANGMGRAMQHVADATPDGKDGIEATRRASVLVDGAADCALAAAFARCIAICTGSRSTASNLVYSTDSGGDVLPLRPVLVGGDDVTLVVEGSVALDVAVAAARAFDGALRRAGFNAGVRVGVALGHVHHPFSRLHGLAAASAARARDARGESRSSWLDWVFVGEDRTGGVTARPYPLDHWDDFRRLVTTLQADAEDRHGQIKRLGADLAAGAPDPRGAWKLRGIPSGGVFTYADEHLGGRLEVAGPGDRRGSPYADAIQLMDFAAQEIP